MQQETAERFLEAVLPAVDAHFAHCTVHGDLPGRAVCPKCRQLYCFACLGLDTETHEVRCKTCAEAEAQRRRVKSAFAWLKHPLTHVLLLLFTALLLFGSRMTFNSPEAMTARDRQQPWFKRGSAQAWLRQALRCRTRAETLRKNGDEAAARNWFGFAATAFANAADVLSDQACRIPLGIAEFSAVGNAGDTDKALTAAGELQTEVKTKPELLMPYLFKRGEIYWAAGNRDAAVNDWRHLLSLTSPKEIKDPLKMHDMITQTLSQMAEGGLFEMAMQKLVQQAADTSPEPRIWQARTLDKAAALGLNDILINDRRAAAQKTAPKKLKIEIERFE